MAQRMDEDDEPIALNAEEYRRVLSKKRADRREEVLNGDLPDMLPSIVDLRVGKDVYRHFGSDLCVDMGNRFKPDLFESGTREIVLDPSDVPEAASVLKILAQPPQPPEKLTRSQLVGVVKTLSYLNATTALSALGCYLPHAVDSSTVTVMLAAVVQERDITSSLFQHLCGLLDTSFRDFQPDSVIEFWDVMAPDVDVSLCQQLEQESGLVGRWLWRALAAIICDGDCSAEQSEDTLLLPTATTTSLHGHWSHIMDKCGLRLCGCRSRILTSMFAHGRLDRDGDVMVVSVTQESVAFAVKVPKSKACTSQVVRVAMSGFPFELSIECEPFSTAGKVVPGSFSAFLFYSLVPEDAALTVTFTFFGIQDAGVLLSGRKSECKALSTRSGSEFPKDVCHEGEGRGWSQMTVGKNAQRHMLLFVEIDVNKL